MGGMARVETPTTPLGQAGGLIPAWSIAGGPGWAAAGWDDNPDLTFPTSVTIYDRMRRTDTQIGSLMRAIALPIRSAAWDLDATGVDPAIAAFVADELNLNRGPHFVGGIDWPDHLRQVLLALAWGFAPFEIVYDIGPARTEGAPATVAHLRGLYPRPPRTITEVRVNPEGDLVGVVQCAPGFDTGVQFTGMRAASAGGATDVWLPRNRLAFYCFEREGADWTGTSLLRGAYKDWWLKEQALRYANQGIERNSMGLPVVGYDDDSDREKALEIATQARAGATAGVAIPRDRMDFTLVGVTGRVSDPMPLVKYHDQAMSRAALAMFLDLGHDSGARSLGDTFVDFFTMSLQSIAEWIAVTTTKEVIRPLVDINFGPGKPIPTLRCEQISATHPATADALKMLVEVGVVTPDRDLEQYMRRAHRLPEQIDTPPQPLMEDARPSPSVGDPVESALAHAESLVQRLAHLAARTR